MRIKTKNKSKKTKSDFLLVLTFQTHYLDYYIISIIYEKTTKHGFRPIKY